MSSDAIRRLNDAFRTTFMGGRLMLTAGVANLPPDRQAEILALVSSFSDFSRDNDPYGEHDFGAITQGGDRFFFKIDNYDIALEHGSDDPADPTKTTRVLTIMFADEY